MAGTEILKGVDLTVRSGEVHAVMGPNGAGKSTLSHVLMGRPGYEVTGGSVTLDGVDLLALPTWERAQAGLFLAMQYPTEVPGVSLVDSLSASFAAGRQAQRRHGARMAAEAERIGFDEQFLSASAQRRPVGRREEAQRDPPAGVLEPPLRHPRRARLRASTSTPCGPCAAGSRPPPRAGLGVLCHHPLHPAAERAEGRSGPHPGARRDPRAAAGPELADRLEDEGYAAWIRPEDEMAASTPRRPVDVFGAESFAEQEPVVDDPFGPGPFGPT